MDFDLPEDDIGFLDSAFGRENWHTIIKDAEQGIVIKKYSLPQGYNQPTVAMMILIPQDYPMAALDMFYLSPDISKTNGKSIGALQNEAHFDKQWQRWSRHYPWKAGTYNIATHMQVVKNSLIEELDR